MKPVVVEVEAAGLEDLRHQPWVPKAAMNANASGMPPKLAATPLKAVTPERSHFGRRSVAAA